MKIKNLFRLIFPPYERDFPGKRWLFVLCLNIHLYAVCGYVGARLFDGSTEQVTLYFSVCVVSGAMMILNDMYANGMWLFQNRGLIIISKVGALALMKYLDSFETILLLGIVFVSGFVSHSRRKFRHYSIIHRKVVEFIPEKGKAED